jgi:hypothetical protein
MLSSLFIALLQSAAGDPAVAAATETPAAEAPAGATEAAPRTERRRVCTEPLAATGGRLTQRRCRWEEVPVEDVPVEATAPDTDSANTVAATTDDETTMAASDTGAGGSSAAPPPAAPPPR